MRKRVSIPATILGNRSKIMYTRLKEHILGLVEKNSPRNRYYEYFNSFILILIILNIAVIIIESFEGIYSAHMQFFRQFEIFSVAVFSVEYLMRLWSADLVHRCGAVRSRVAFVLSPMAIIDLLAILPFYLPMFLPIDLRFLRVLRLLRIFRIFKLKRYIGAIDVISDVFRKKKEDLLVTFVVAFFVMLVSSTIMYYAEHDAQPQSFSNIVASFWWAVATLTTVGYGDIYPITAVGKVISSVIAFIGIGLVALPTGIISAGFIDEMHLARDKKEHEEKGTIVCPHCGKKIIAGKEKRES
jgi:voltage-gated potassium channel